MDKSIEQSLNGLMSTLTGPLPPELRELAVSLLAQSRVRASTLKADEEIARSYVCASLACERLEQTLALPKIHLQPPCPPKIYQKLYRFLDAALPAGTRRSDRAPKINASTKPPTSSPAKPRTPVRRTPLKPTTPRRKTQYRAQTIPEVPKWVMPTIRHLCKSLAAHNAPPHVFAGVSSILTLPPPREPDSTSRAADSTRQLKIPALIVAVLFIVTTRLAGVETPAGEYARQTAIALALLKDRGAELGDQGNLEDVNECMREIRDKGWNELDWFANIPVGGGSVTQEAGNSEGEAFVDDEGVRETLIPFKKSTDVLKHSHNNYLQAGLGTMMRDQVDYLSEKRRVDYQEWKTSIMLRIGELQNVHEMDVTAG